MEPEIEVKEVDKQKEGQKKKLWNMNFFLLWQGQALSAFGDILYEVALGFWVLAVTGSTGLMGTLMASSTLPRVIISPFAGVWVDRSDRKRMLVVMDLIRGIAILFVGIAAYQGFIQIWMVFVAGVIMGICAAFFQPAIGSAIPDIVPKEKIVQANSAFALIGTGSSIIGLPAGGVMYTILGAPLMFTLNGISYLISSFTELFIKIPEVVHEKKEFHFWEDMKDGFKYVWKEKGLRLSMMVFAGMNFFAFCGIVLILPLFDRTDSLGPVKYGIAMAGLTGGMFAGFLLTSLFPIKAKNRFTIFYLCAVVGTPALALFPLYLYFPLMMGLFIFFGITNSILNAIIMAVIQLAVPSDKRGKVFSLIGTITGGLTPLGMAFGGILGEFLPLHLVISGAFFATWLLFLPLILLKDIREFINLEGETSDKEEKKSESY